MRYFLAGVLGLLLLVMPYAGSADAPRDPIKWSQLPDMYGGLDFSTEIKVPSLVADDWLCRDGLPVMDIHWWGSYWIPPSGYTYYSDKLPNAVPPPGVVSLTLAIWSDVPQGPGVPFSHPGQQLWSHAATNFNETFYGKTEFGEDVYQYFVRLPEEDWFLQEKETIYWLSIQANFPNSSNQWGWHESKYHWNDATVQDFMGSGWYALRNNLYDVDMAFELTTVPEPGSLASLAVGLLGMVGWVARRMRRDDRG